MGNRKVVAYVAAALVAGLVLGSFGIASAAPASRSTTTTALGIRMGATIKSAGATLADVVAKLTGTTTDAVRDQREDGTSFAQIAAAKGVSADKVVADTLAARKALLDQAVKAGQITQTQADAALARMKTQLTTRVSDTTACTGTGTGGGRMGGRGMGGGRGAGTGACGTCTQVPAVTQ